MILKKKMTPLEEIKDEKSEVTLQKLRSSK
jgi:hypothetical protein